MASRTSNLCLSRYNETASWYHFACDERWRIVAMYEDDADASEPTEQFWYHNAGTSGLGGSSYIDDVVLRDRDTDGNGTLDERRYYLQNQHHDVVALVNTSGSISERVNYDPYGSPIGTFTSIANRKGYAGYEYDEELGDTYHVRHRVYRSDLGVWTRRDPLGYVDGMGLYEYAMSAAVSTMDALGLAISVRQCQQDVTACSSTDPLVTYWLAKLAKASCSRPTITCYPRDGHNTCKSPTTMGFYECDTNSIGLCPQNMSPPNHLEDICRYMAHELSHAYDTCQGRSSCTREDCAFNRICSEIRAYANDGGCCQGSFLRHWGESFPQCVIRRAKASVPGCNVEAEWDACFRTFDRNDFPCNKSSPTPMPIITPPKAPLPVTTPSGPQRPYSSLCPPPGNRPCTQGCPCND